MKNNYKIKAKLVITPENQIKEGIIEIKGKIIEGIYNSSSDNKNIIDIGDKIIFPALINAHDHLLGNYYPRVGKGPYINWLPWDNDLKSSPVYAERSKIPPKEIYLLGSYRNILSGVTTVSDHIPHFVNEPYLNILPIRVIKDYTLAHESSNYDLKWGDGIEVEFQKAVENDIPFITHIEEGYDEESKRGIEILLEKNALDEHTVLIHAIALSDDDIKAVAEKRANIVWCPNSNIFMFNRTGNIKKWLENNINVSLGTDSPMSGGLNILDELKFGKKIYKEKYNEEISDDILIKFITINAAKALRVYNKIGSLEKGKIADFIAIEGNVDSPYTSLVNAELKDISLVVYEGKPLYGNIEYEDYFKDIYGSKKKLYKFKVEKREKIGIFDPLALLNKIRGLVGFKKELPFLPVEK